MSEKLKKYILNTLIFTVAWNLLLMIFRRPYVFNVWRHLVLPLVIGPLFTMFDLKNKALLDRLIEEPKQKKKWDPYDHS